MIKIVVAGEQLMAADPIAGCTHGASWYDPDEVN